jgi:hypothetical protein
MDKTRTHDVPWDGKDGLFARELSVELYRDITSELDMLCLIVPYRDFSCPEK